MTNAERAREILHRDRGSNAEDASWWASVAESIAAALETAHREGAEEKDAEIARLRAEVERGKADIAKAMEDRDAWLSECADVLARTVGRHSVGIARGEALAGVEAIWIVRYYTMFSEAWEGDASDPSWAALLSGIAAKEVERG